MKYLTQTTDITSEKIKDLDYGRVVLDTTTGSVYLLGYGIKYQTVDLGLTSGTLWMDRHVGAEEITDSGLFFAWGETQGYTADEIGVSRQFIESEYKYYDSSSNSYTKYNGSDGLTTLEETDDAAFQTTHKFYMPTIEQCVELLMETDVYFIKADGTEIHGTWTDMAIEWDSTVSNSDELNGIEFRKKDDNNVKLFIPISGYATEGNIDGIKQKAGGMWANSNMNAAITPWGILFLKDGVLAAYGGIPRFCGAPIRGVNITTTKVSEAVQQVVAAIIEVLNQQLS